jgi:hypothetical protein
VAGAGAAAVIIVMALYLRERIIRTEGREEIVREEVRGPVLEITDSAKVSEPVFEPTMNQNRWLVGAGLVDFRPGDRQAWAAYGGYSFGNRLDLCAGVSGRGRPSVLVMLRF